MSYRVRTKLPTHYSCGESNCDCGNDPRKCVFKDAVQDILKQEQYASGRYYECKYALTCRNPNILTFPTTIGEHDIIVEACLQKNGKLAWIHNVQVVSKAVKNRIEVEVPFDEEKDFPTLPVKTRSVKIAKPKLKPIKTKTKTKRPLPPVPQEKDLEEVSCEKKRKIVLRNRLVSGATVEDISGFFLDEIKKLKKEKADLKRENKILRNILDITNNRNRTNDTDEEEENDYYEY